MKVIIALCFLVVVALAKPQHDHDPHNMKEVHEKCQQDPAVHVDESVIKDLREHGKDAKLPENFGKHVACMAKGLGMMGEDGKIIEEGVKTHVGHVEKDAAKQETIVKECCVEKATAEETAKSLWECLSKNHVFGGAHRHHGSSESGSSESDEHHH